MNFAVNYRAIDCYGKGLGEYKMPIRKLYQTLYPGIQPQRTKIGFGIPLIKWLENDINKWAIDIVKKKTLISQTIDYSPLITELENRKITNSVLTWSLIYLQVWYLKYAENRSNEEIFFH